MPSVAAGSSSRSNGHAESSAQAKRRGNDDGGNARRRAARDEEDEEDEAAEDGDDVEVVGGNVAEGEMLEKQTRDTRLEYREILKMTQGAKSNLADFGVAGLKKIVQQTGELFQGVRGPQEGILDSRVLIQAGALGAQLATEMKIESGFEVEEFLERTMRMLGGRLKRINEDEDDDADVSPDEWNWDQLGRHAAAYSHRAVAMDHLLGPLASEAKTRTFVAREGIDRSGNKTQPQELESDTIANVTPETSALVQSISKMLERIGGAEGINLFRFVINPHSFANTVENMFYVSFLVREGTASIEDNADGEPILLCTEAPDPEDYNQGMTRRQIIMELDMAVWENLIKAYDIRDTIIPTREGANQVADTWQATQGG